MSGPADRIAGAVTGPLADLGVDLETVDVQRAGRRHVVRVVVDRDGGVDLDTVAEVSRLVSGVLDEPSMAEVVPGPFVLEVTSPGVDRPLTKERHWRRAHGRLVAVDLVDGAALTGRVGPVHDESVELTTAQGPRVVALADVGRAVVQVEFSRSATQTDDDDEPDDEPGNEPGNEPGARTTPAQPRT